MLSSSRMRNQRLNGDVFYFSITFNLRIKQILFKNKMSFNIFMGKLFLPLNNNIFAPYQEHALFNKINF